MISHPTLLNFVTTYEDLDFIGCYSIWGLVFNNSDPNRSVTVYKHP